MRRRVCLTVIAVHCHRVRDRPAGTEPAQTPRGPARQTLTRTPGEESLLGPRPDPGPVIRTLEGVCPQTLWVKGSEGDPCLSPGDTHTFPPGTPESSQKEACQPGHPPDSGAPAVTPKLFTRTPRRTHGGASTLGYRKPERRLSDVLQNRGSAPEGCAEGRKAALR